MDGIIQWPTQVMILWWINLLKLLHDIDQITDFFIGCFFQANVFIVLTGKLYFPHHSDKNMRDEHISKDWNVRKKIILFIRTIHIQHANFWPFRQSHGSCVHKFGRSDEATATRQLTLINWCQFSGDCEVSEHGINVQFVQQKHAWNNLFYKSIYQCG